MYYQHHNKSVGIMLVVLGIIAIIISIGPLLLPLLLGLGGLYLINLGLRLCGKPPIIFIVNEMWQRRYTIQKN